VSDQVKFVLDETHIPKTWYNLTADLPKPLPPVLHPGTKQPIGPADLEPLFPMELILQEVSGRALHRYSAAGTRRLSDVAALAADPRPAT